MSEWVLVPISEIEPKCVNGHDRCAEGPFDACPYCERARPPIPTAVWDAMVERAAKAICCGNLPCGGCMPSTYAKATRDADAALRAALGQPVVEGDEG